MVLDFKLPIHPPLVGVLDPTHLLFRSGQSAVLLRSVEPFYMSSIACNIPLCRSWIKHTFSTFLTIICFTLCKNQYQVSPDSFSTKANIKGNNCLLPSAATAVRIVPLYFLVKMSHLCKWLADSTETPQCKRPRPRTTVGIPAFYASGHKDTFSSRSSYQDF